MSDTSDLLTGIATMIAGAGLGITYSPAGTYLASQTGIFMKIMPATPDRVVTLTAVNQGDNITMPLGQVMVQVRGRGIAGNPVDVDDLLDSIFNILHGTTNLTFGGLTVIQMNRKVSVPMGMDDSKRWERVDQYYLDVSTPPTALRPASGSW